MTDPIVPVPVDLTPDVKPGFKTTEFWLSTIAMLLGVVMASGAVHTGGMVAQIVGGALSVLASLGYTASRTQIKKQ